MFNGFLYLFTILEVHNNYLCNIYDWAEPPSLLYCASQLFGMPASGLTTEYKWARYLPIADDYKEPDLEDYDHVEPSTRVDPTKEPGFLARATSVTEISPEIGTEIRGLQLSALTPEQLDELSLLLGRRALVVFRGQDFADLSCERQKEIVSSDLPRNS